MVGTLSTTGSGSAARQAEEHARLLGMIAVDPKRYQTNLEALIKATHEAEASEKAAKAAQEKASKALARAQAKLDELDRLTTEREAAHAQQVAALDRRQSALDGREAKLKTERADFEAHKRKEAAALAERGEAMVAAEIAVHEQEVALTAAVEKATEATEAAEAIKADYEARLAELRKIVSQG